MGLALEYLGMVGGEVGADSAELRDRIFRCGAGGVPPDAPTPPFPFVAQDVPPAPELATPTPAPMPTASGILLTISICIALQLSAA